MSAAQTGCIVPEPKDPLKMFQFFDASAPRRLCEPRPGEERVVLALSPYRTKEEVAAAHRWLAAAGFERKINEAMAGGVRLLTFERGPADASSGF